MIQLILMLIGFGFPNHNVGTIDNSSSPLILQGNTAIGEELDTGGETIPLPPKK